LDKDDSQSSELEQQLESTLGQPFVEGNSIRSLRNGDAIFPAMLQALEDARERIDFLTFVYWTGDIARQFAETLARRAREGLRVRVLLDAFGCRSMPDDLVSLLEIAGARVEFFRPLGIGLGKAKHRTHRKILVCDDRVGFTGGVGIAAEWTGDARGPEEWRDTHFRIEGPAVAGLRSAFLMNWVEVVGVENAEPVHPEAPQVAGPTRIQVLRTSSAARWSDAAYALRLCIAHARESLCITTAYFVPDEHALRLLGEAVRRGVRVRILIPGEHTDSRLTRWAAQDHVERLLETGVELWCFEPTMLHAKILTVDSELSLIGSANFNHRSMSEDDEVLLAVTDSELAATLERHFEADLERSRRVELADWRRRGWTQRALEVLTRPVRGMI
jgi:cardiolipin synthase A/B